MKIKPFEILAGLALSGLIVFNVYQAKRIAKERWEEQAKYSRHTQQIQTDLNNDGITDIVRYSPYAYESETLLGNSNGYVSLNDYKLSQGLNSNTITKLDWKVSEEIQQDTLDRVNRRQK